MKILFFIFVFLCGSSISAETAIRMDKWPQTATIENVVMFIKSYSWESTDETLWQTRLWPITQALINRKDSLGMKNILPAWKEATGQDYIDYETFDNPLIYFIQQNDMPSFDTLVKYDPRLIDRGDSGWRGTYSWPITAAISTNQLRWVDHVVKLGASINHEIDAGAWDQIGPISNLLSWAKSTQIVEYLRSVGVVDQIVHETYIFRSVVNDSNVNVRETPSTRGKVMGKLMKGDKIEIMGNTARTEAIPAGSKEHVWYLVKSETITGWVFGAFVSTE